jgi:hypothetical protein
MLAVIEADPIEARMRKAQKEGKLPQRTLAERRQAALASGLITQQEHDHLVRTDRLRRDVIKVDDHEHDLGRAQREDSWPQSEAKKKAIAASM